MADRKAAAAMLPAWWVSGHRAWSPAPLLRRQYQPRRPSVKRGALDGVSSSRSEVRHAQAEHARNTGSTNRAPATEPAAHRVATSRISRELVQPSGPQRSIQIVQRPCRNARRPPLLLHDNDLVHERDLARPAARNDQSRPPPTNPERLREGDPGGTPAAGAEPLPVPSARLSPRLIVSGFTNHASNAGPPSRLPGVEAVVERRARLGLREVVARSSATAPARPRAGPGGLTRRPAVVVSAPRTMAQFPEQRRRARPN